MAKQVCVTAGKAAGSVVREAANVTESVRKGASSVSKTCISVAKSASEAVQEVTLKFGNLCSRVKTDSQFAYWETKQKEVFGKLGQEIFTLVQSNVAVNFEEPKLKELLEDIRKYETEIQRIKDEMAAQRQKMELAISLKRAESDLKSKDPRTRRVAIRILERIGSKEGIPYLTAALNDSDQEVRTRAAEVMHKLVNNVKEEPAVQPEQQQNSTPAESVPPAQPEQQGQQG